MSFVSDTHSFDSFEEALEGQFELGVTDGLPVVPPTPERVAEMLAAGGVSGETILGEAIYSEYVKSESRKG